MTQDRESPSVTVIIPAHDAARWIRRAVDSVRAQTVPIAEVIVVDDHSNDATAAVAAAGGGNVRVVPATGRGSNPARNAGLREARSEWIQFLDADDFLLPDKIARQLTAAGDSVDLVYSPSLMIYGDEMPTSTSSPRRDATGGEDDAVLALLQHRGFQTGAVLWRASALRTIGGWNDTVARSQDYEVAFRALRAGLRPMWSPFAGAAYCIHDDASLSRAQPLATLQSDLALLEATCAWLRTVGRYSSRHARVAHDRGLALLWAAAPAAPDWSRDNYARLVRDGLVRPRWFGSKIETCLRLLGWSNAVKLRGGFGARPAA
jgi:glycosyltransferase involved in cell wall biosynthesis